MDIKLFGKVIGTADNVDPVDDYTELYDDVVLTKLGLAIFGNDTEDALNRNRLEINYSTGEAFLVDDEGDGVELTPNWKALFG